MTKKAPENIKFLKFIVQFMGVILVVGTIFVFYVAIQRYQDKIAEKSEKSSEKCETKEFLLPEKGDIKSVTYEGSNITVVLEDDLEGIKTQKILIVDMCNHEVKHKVVVNQ